MKLLLSLLCSLLYVTAYSQDAFYAYKGDWTGTTNLKEAKFFMHVERADDTSHICRYYNIFGPLIRMETYVDEELTTARGRFAWYNESGQIDSTGIVVNGRKHGYWLYFTNPDSSFATITEEYNNGRFLRRINRISGITTYSDGRTVSHNQPNEMDSSNAAIVVQQEASFQGGMIGWRKYLEKNLKIPERYIKSVKGNSRATVKVMFAVDTTGSIGDMYLSRSVEWSVDTEAQRVISKGPKWIPATQNGKAVKYRQVQSITFVVQE